MTLPQSEEETLLGFDAREVWLTPESRVVGLGGRPTEFLLRTDVDDVLSADIMVWPSIFKSTVSQERGPELPLPRWVGMNEPFWEDLDGLCKAIPPDFGEKHPFWLIAATWHTDIGFPNEEKQQGKILGPHISLTRPERRSSAWRFLGFDITDSGISGLSNCCYDASQRDGLAREWGGDLNRYHLFDSVERAFEFRKLTNARVPEHAPFFVIGLWLITKSIPK